MQPRTKAIFWGAFLGTILLGPGAGTLIGAKLGAARHDQKNQRAANDNDEHDVDYSRAS